MQTPEELQRQIELETEAEIYRLAPETLDFADWARQRTLQMPPDQQAAVYSLLYAMQRCQRALEQHRLDAEADLEALRLQMPAEPKAPVTVPVIGPRKSVFHALWRLRFACHIAFSKL